LILIAVEGFSAAQAGEVLGISEGAAAVRVHRARAAMVAALADLDRKPEETR
jgi:DNA-directed RNA polymerase specialized sigma24 family protein